MLSKRTIIGLVVSGFIAFAISITGSRFKTYTVQEVHANARQALDLISQKVNQGLNFFHWNVQNIHEMFNVPEASFFIKTYSFCKQSYFLYCKFNIGENIFIFEI